MWFAHYGATVRPSAVRAGKTFAARTLIRSERGTEWLLNLGTFASKTAALQVAIVSTLAYIEGLPLLTPVKVFHSEDIPTA